MNTKLPYDLQKQKLKTADSTYRGTTSGTSKIRKDPFQSNLRNTLNLKRKNQDSHVFLPTTNTTQLSSNKRDTMKGTMPKFEKKLNTVELFQKLIKGPQNYVNAPKSELLRNTGKTKPYWNAKNKTLPSISDKNRAQKPASRVTQQHFKKPFGRTSIRRFRNPWGQTIKKFKNFRRPDRLRFQKRYKVFTQTKRLRYSYFRDLDYFFNNVMWLKKSIRAEYGSMTKHGLNKFYGLADKKLQREESFFEKFFGGLESLLPVALYRLRLVPSVKTAKEFIKHGHIFVNQKKIKYVNYKLHPGDVVELSKTLRKKFKRRYRIKWKNSKFRYKLKRRRRFFLHSFKNQRFRFYKKKRKKRRFHIRNHRPRYFEFSKRLRGGIFLYKPPFYEIPYNKYKFSFKMYLFLLNNFRYIKY